MVQAISGNTSLQWEETMKTRYTVALSILAGVAVGAAAVQALHAQAKPPAYVVAEIDVTNAEPYDKEYVPPAAKAVTDAGGKYVVRGGRTVAIFGQPPQPRIAVMVFESMEKANAAFESSAYKEAKKIGDKYAKFGLCRGRLGAIAVATRTRSGKRDRTNTWSEIAFQSERISLYAAISSLIRAQFLRPSRPVSS